ncbi:MAG: DCC1-like thiol-disulfide oxidoreductase family protein [Halobacteriaceae archaeon]
MAPPRLVYDDDCGFCTWSAAVAYRYADVDPVGFSELTPDQRARLPEDFETCAHLLTHDAVYSCGEASERVIVRALPILRPVRNLLVRVPGYERAREGLYRWIADRRGLWGRVVRLHRLDDGD